MDRRTAFDLVPVTARGSTLRTLLSRKQWDRVRRRSREEAGDKCELCGRKGRRIEGVRSMGLLEGHELWAYDDRRKCQSLVAVQTVCPDCHQALHWEYPDPPDPNTSNRYHLGPAWAMVELIERAGWKADELKAHHELVIGQLRARSAHFWTLDVRAAERYGYKLGVLTPEQRLVVHRSSDAGRRDRWASSRLPPKEHD